MANNSNLTSLVRMAEDLAEPWRSAALCRGEDTNDWFPERGERCDYALAVCDACPVWGECLLYALRTSERFGVLGRLRHSDRRHLKVAIRDLGAPPTDVEILTMAAELAADVRARLCEEAAQVSDHAVMFGADGVEWDFDEVDQLDLDLDIDESAPRLPFPLRPSIVVRVAPSDPFDVEQLSLI